MNKGDIVIISKNLNKERLKLGLPIINEDLTGKEVTFLRKDVPVTLHGKTTEVCRVTGINVTRNSEGHWEDDINMDISELLIPMKALKLK